MQVKDIVNSMNIGVSKQTLEGKATSPMHTLMIGLQQEVIDLLTASIDKYNISASNRLKQSIISVDESTDGTISIALSANFYWKYVNYGVNGTAVNHGAPSWGSAPAGTETFHQAISGWIRDKGLKAHPGQTYEQMAFAIMRKLKTEGQAPKPFYSDVINKKLTAYLTKSVSEVFKKAITIQIKDPFK